MFVRLAVLSYLMCACVSVFGGDGRLIDKGPLEPNWRYILDLGPVLLDQDGSYSFEIEGLPSAEFVVGFEVKLDPPEKDFGDRRPLGATAELKLLNSEGKTLISERAPLRDWTWSTPSDGEWAFIYRFGEPGTTFFANSAGRYRLVLSVSDASSTSVRYPVSLYAKAAGWK